MKFSEEYRPSTEEILTENIWFSDRTKYKTSIVKEWDAKGLRFIQDLYNPTTGAIYTKQNIETIYGIRMTFLCYASLIRSLPQDIQEQTETEWIKKPNIPYKMNLVCNQNKFSKYAYNVFVSNASENNIQSIKRLEAKWILGIGEYAKGTVQKVASATMSTYLIYLHFKIMHRIYGTNKYLFKINVTQSSVCTFCNDSIETIVHLFWSCPKTQIYIKEILSHLKERYSVTMDMSANKWFLLTDMSNMNVLIVTLIKASIHKARMRSSQLSLHATLQSLKLEASKEQVIAKSKQKELFFEQKWGKLSKLVTEPY